MRDAAFLESRVSRVISMAGLFGARILVAEFMIGITIENPGN
jgi:hypothetical protein